MDRGRRMFQSLAPSLLLATPTLLDPNFRQTVVLLFAHGPEGALGLVINRPSPEPLRKVLEATGLPNPGEDIGGRPVFLGGPVQLGTGWVLFRGTDPRGESFPAGPDLRVTGSQRVFRDLLTASPVPTFRFCLGNAGWAPDQLESEIREGAWMTAPVDLRIVFEVPPDQCWRQAWLTLGVDPSLWSFSVGDG
ncbi:MAG TPA: YqgE/AlgH family protein [Myxococcota bacterium]|nr:YqgE/AlgH family protein [Myxococcota bacterium]HQK49835.1 YqgE/AlgH family protein [Myxococcota bacterium]